MWALYIGLPPVYSAISNAPFAKESLNTMSDWSGGMVALVTAGAPHAPAMLLGGQSCQRCVVPLSFSLKGARHQQFLTLRCSLLPLPTLQS